jgi:hypothetical protein
MPRHDGEIHRATIRNFTHRASAPALGETYEQVHPGGIAETFEQLRIEKVINGIATFRGLSGSQYP